MSFRSIAVGHAWRLGAVIALLAALVACGKSEEDQRRESEQAAARTAAFLAQQQSWREERKADREEFEAWKAEHKKAG